MCLQSSCSTMTALVDEGLVGASKDTAQPKAFEIDISFS